MADSPGRRCTHLQAAPPAVSPLSAQGPLPRLEEPDSFRATQINPARRRAKIAERTSVATGRSGKGVRCQRIQEALPGKFPARA